MFSRSLFHHRQFTISRFVALCAVLFVVALATAVAVTQRSHAAGKRQSLSFEERVAAQRAIEEVYHRHRIWPADNPQPKPSLEALLGADAWRDQSARVVEDALRLSTALAAYWQSPVTAADLQAEVDRMARDTRQPEVLRELWAALRDDPLLVAECLARPLLAERLVRLRFEDCGLRNEGCEALGLVNSAHPQSPISNLQSPILNPQFDEWWRGVRAQMEMAEAAGGEYRLPEIAAVAAPCGGEAWAATNTTGAPSARDSHTAVWTGSEMIVWGGYNGSIYTGIGGRYNPATDSWTAINTVGAPTARGDHTAVWTGTEMIIWGGRGDGGSVLNTGGRYNPTTNSWTATNTTGTPSARYLHTAIWTGSEMIVWGGGGAPLFGTDTGGRYSPAADSWTATATTGAPSSRGDHTAVWTGSEMIVWGGNNFIGSIFNTGGRYNPTTNSWAATNTTAAPSARYVHTAIWTGSEMIVWGGNTGDQFGDLNTGGRYNPTMDSWAAINTTESPEPRSGHTMVWTGSEMIIWGGVRRFDYLNTGGRYNPGMNKWVTITTTGAPLNRYSHTAVWTGPEMVVLGGIASTDPTSNSNTGGRYSIAPPLTLSSIITQPFTTAGGAGVVSVITQGGCTWTATSNANWLTFTATGSPGDGAVSFSVAANTLGPRTGILTIGTRSFIVRQAGVATPRVVRAVTTGSAPGNIAVPLEIVSQGDENALGFTLTFDPAVLGNPQVALGADAAGALLSTNTNQVAQGRIGIAMALAAGQKFAAGTRQFAVVTFTTPANLTAGMTQIDFDDLPSAREVSDVSANALPASYQGGSISIVSGLEADVAPRPQGNGSVSITDWVQVGRLVAGLDTAAAGIEFQRADCAPRDTKGDGRLTVSDWVQAGRYSVGVDANVAAGGPTLAAASSSLAASVQSTGFSRNPGVLSPGFSRNVRSTTLPPKGGTTNIELDARGDENALGFSLRFDPAAWRFVSATVGSDASGATLHVNDLAAKRGSIGLALALPAGRTLAAGTRQIVVLNFAAVHNSSGRIAAIEFADFPVMREVVDAEANVLPAAFGQSQAGSKWRRR